MTSRFNRGLGILPALILAIGATTVFHTTAIPHADGLPLKPVCDKECPNEAFMGPLQVTLTNKTLPAPCNPKYPDPLNCGTPPWMKHMQCDGSPEQCCQNAGGTWNQMTPDEGYCSNDAALVSDHMQDVALVSHHLPSWKTPGIPCEHCGGAARECCTDNPNPETPLHCPDDV